MIQLPVRRRRRPWANIRPQATALEDEHPGIIRDNLLLRDFWGGVGSVTCQEFITQLGRNFQVNLQAN